MDYRAIYHRLIITSQQITHKGYTETHHIIPRCLGGSDCVSNKVKLSARHHFVAHKLLMLIHPDSVGLATAVVWMGSDRKTGRRLNNRLYGWERERCARLLSESRKGIPMSEDVKIKLSKANKGKRTYEMTDLTRERMSKSATGKIISSEQKIKISETLKKNYVYRPISEETRVKLRKAGKLQKRNHTQATKEKLSQAATGRIFSQETKDKISAAAKKREADRRAARASAQA